MLKFAMWMLIGTVLAGIAVIAIVAVPAYYDMGMKLIPIAVIAGFVAAIPLAFVISKKITSLTA